MDKEKVLREYVQTAINDNYDFKKVNDKFPEIDSLISGVPSAAMGIARKKLEYTLREYVQTAINENYDFSKVNGKFPEFFPELKKKGTASPQAQAVVTDTGEPALVNSPLASSVEKDEPVVSLQLFGDQTLSFEPGLAQTRAKAFTETLEKHSGLLASDASAKNIQDQKDKFYSQHPNAQVRDAWGKVKSGKGNDDLQAVLDENSTPYPPTVAYIDSYQRGSVSSDPSIREAAAKLAKLEFEGIRMFSAEAKEAEALKAKIQQSPYYGDNKPELSVAQQLADQEYKKYDFAELTPFVEDVKVSLKTELGGFMNERMPEYIAENALPTGKKIKDEIKSLQQELKDNSDLSLTQLKQIRDGGFVYEDTKWGKRKKEIERRLATIENKDGGVSEEYLIQTLYEELYNNEFAPSFKSAILNAIPSEKKNDREFIEAFEDKLFFEKGMNLNLDGDNRHNVLPWYTQAGKALIGSYFNSVYTVKAGIENISRDLGMDYGPAVEQQQQLSEIIGLSQTQYDYGAGASFGRGDIGNGMMQVLNGVSAALPQVASQIGLTYVGMPHLGAMMWGTVGGLGTLNEMKSAKDDYGNLLYSNAEIYGTAIATTAIEYGTELVMSKVILEPAMKGLKGGISVKDIFSKEFRNAYNGTYAQLLRKAGQGAVGRYGIDASIEGASEWLGGTLSDFSQAAITGELSKFDLNESLKNNLDGAIIGAATGLLASGAGGAIGPNLKKRSSNAANSPFDLWYQNNITTYDKRLRDLNEMYNQATSSKEMVEVRNQMDELGAERQKLINKRASDLFVFAANNTEAFDRVSMINAELAKTSIEIKRAKEKNDIKGVKFSGEKFKALVLEKSLLLETKFEPNPRAMVDANRSLIDDSLSQIDEAIRLANHDYDALTERDDELLAAGNENVVNEHIIATDKARTRVEELKRKKEEINEEVNKRNELEDSLKEAINNGEDSEYINNLKSLLRSQEAIIDDMLGMSGTGASASDLYTESSSAPTSDSTINPLRDAKWDSTFKGSLPQSVFQSIEQLSEALSSGTWGMLTAENPMRSKLSEEENAELNRKAVAWLKSKGYKPQQIFGKYDNSESSFFVDGLTREDALEFAEEFNQESVAHSEAMIYQDGSTSPRTRQDATGSDPDNYYSTVNIGGQLVNFQVGYDFDQRFDKDGNKIEKPSEVDPETTNSEAIIKLLEQSSSESHDSYKPNSDGTFNIDWGKYGVTDPDAINSINNFIGSLSKKSKVKVNGIVLLTGPNSTNVDRGVYREESGIIVINIDKINSEVKNSEVKSDEMLDFNTELQMTIQEEFVHSLTGAIIRSMPPDVRTKILTDLISLFKSDINVLDRFVTKVNTYIKDEKDLSPEKRKKIADIIDRYKIDESSDASAIAIELANEIADLSTTGEESIQEVLNYATITGSKIEANLWPKIIAWLNDLRAKLGFPPSIDSEIKAIDYIKGIQRARSGYTAFKPGKGKQGVTAASKSMPTPVIIPRKLRSLDGRSKKAYMDENTGTTFIDPSDLPDGPFEISYEVLKEYRSRGRKQSYTEERTHKFNDRAHFMNWWKKTNIHKDSDYGRTDQIKGYLGSSEVFPGKKDRFRLFQFDGKIIDTEALEATYLPPAEVPFFRVSVKGPGSFSFNSLVTDLKALYDDGLITKKEYYEKLHFAKISLNKIKDAETSNRNADYWMEVESLKRSHISMLQFVPYSLKDAGVEAIFEPTKGFYGPPTGERIPDFPTYTGWKNGATGSTKFNSSAALEKIKRNPELVDSKVKELTGQDVRALGKDSVNRSKMHAARVMVIEDYRKNHSVSTEQDVELLLSKIIMDEFDSIKRMTEGGEAKLPDLPGQFQENYNEARSKIILDANKKHKTNLSELKTGSAAVVFTMIDGVCSDGNRQQSNSDLTLKIYNATVSNYRINAKWEVDSSLLDNDDFKRLATPDRIKQMKNNIDQINIVINKFRDKSTGTLNAPALSTWLQGKSKEPNKTNLSNAQVVFARSAENDGGAMGKIGAYVNYLLGNSEYMAVDTHNLQMFSIFNAIIKGGDYIPKGTLTAKGKKRLKNLAKKLDPNYTHESPEGLISFFSGEGIMDKINNDESLKKSFCSAVSGCFKIENISTKEAKKYTEIASRVANNLPDEFLINLGFTDAEGKVRKIGPADIGQLFYIISQIGSTGATTPASRSMDAALSNSSSLLNTEYYFDYMQSINVSRQTGERLTSEFEGVKTVQLSGAEILGDVIFTPNKDATEDAWDGNMNAIASAVSQSGTPKTIDQRTMQMVELTINPFKNRYPITASGEMVSKAETVVIKNGKMYVSGKIEVVPNEGNSNPLDNGGIKLTDQQAADAIENISTALQAEGLNIDPTKGPSIDPQDVFVEMSAEGQKKAVNNTFESRSNGRVIRRTVGRAASKMPGIKQDLLANPENYIAPQNLQNIKDNLENMSEQDLISMMRDDALGMLQNRNDDTGVMAGAELLNRAMQRGDSGAAKLLIEELAKMGTSAGRILRQFRELKLSTPKGMSDVLQKLIEGKGNTLTPEQKAQLDTVTENMYKLRDEYNDLVKRSMAGEDLDADLARVSNSMADVEKDLNTMMNSLYERGWGEIGKMLIQGNLLTPMSQVTNVGANVVNLFGNTFIDLLSVPLERTLNLLGMNVEYKRRFSFMAYMHGFKAMGAGFVEAGKSAVTGKRIDQSTEWTQTRGFMPIQSLLSVLSKEDLPLNSKGMPSMSQRLKLLAQATVGVPAEVMFRLLSFGDIPFRRFAEAKDLYNIGKSKGLSGEALKKFMRFPDKNSLDIAQREGRKLTFQEKTTVSEFSRKAVEATERLMSDGLRYVVGDKVVKPEEVSKFIIGAHIPYLMTPSNILHETMTYLSPVYATARIASGIRRKDARAISENFGKMVVGSMLTSTAVFLIKEGLMSGALDIGEDEEKNIAYDQFPPSSINITALRRVLNGGDGTLRENDRFVGYSKLGIPGAVFGAVAKGVDKEALQDMDYGQMNFAHKAFMGYLGVSPMAGVSSVMDQSFMQGMETMLSTISSAGDRDFDQNIEKALSTFFKAVTATALPNTLSAVHRAGREYMPDMRVTRDMTMAERTLQSFKYAIMDRTFNTDGIPVRVDWKGNKIKQTPTGADPIIYQLFDITKSRASESDKVSNEIWRLYEKTGELTDAVGTPNFAKKAVFDIPGDSSLRSKKVRQAVKSLSRQYTFLDDEEFTSSNTYLNTQRLNELMEIAGKMRYRELESLIATEAFSAMSDEEKISAMNKVDSRYTHKIAMDGDVLMPHTIKILDYMQDDYESIEQE